MTMPHASSASLIPDHDDSGEEEEEDNTPTVVPMSQDSVEENDKDFAPPPKKLKVEENDKDFAKLKGEEEEEDNTPTVVPMSQDSVENDKDFAKLKGEEEDNTPVVSMSQDSVEENDKDFAPPPKKLEDSDLEEEEEEDVPKQPYTEEEARQAFDLWREMFLVEEYADRNEYEKRFKFFKASLYRKVSPIWEMTSLNKMSLADRSPREIHADGHYCSITIKEIHEWYEEDYRYKQNFF